MNVAGDSQIPKKQKSYLQKKGGAKVASPFFFMYTEDSKHRSDERYHLILQMTCNQNTSTEK